MRLLVTGAAGFIGSHFVRHWVSEHPRDSVIALDALTYAGTETNLLDVREHVTFVHGDIADAEHVRREHDVNVIVNFAAESHNSLAVLDPARFFRTNVMGGVRETIRWYANNREWWQALRDRAPVTEDTWTRPS